MEGQFFVKMYRTQEDVEARVYEGPGLPYGIEILAYQYIEECESVGVAKEIALDKLRLGLNDLGLYASMTVAEDEVR